MPKQKSYFTLRSDQKNVVNKILNKGVRGYMVFHGTGCGKTVIAVAAAILFLKKNKNKMKVLVITPASLVSNFQNTLIKFGLSVNDPRFVFYSYDQYKNKFTGKKGRNCINHMLIIDEAHNFRNTGKRYVPVFECSEKAKKIIILTATPYVNNIRDLVPLINLANGKLVVTDKDIRKLTTTEAMKYFKKYMVGRLDYKKTCADTGYFPKVKHFTKYILMSAKFYSKYKKAISETNKTEFENPKAFYNGYRRGVSTIGTQYVSQKVNMAVDIAKTGKTVIYTNWLTQGIKPLEDKLKLLNIPTGVFTGSVTRRQKQILIEKYNNNELKVLLITKSGAEGLDLKETRNLIILDPTWNQALMSQIEGRAIRYKSHINLPKKQQTVNVYYLIMMTKKDQKTLKNKNAKKEDFESGDVILYKIIEQKKNEERIVDRFLKKYSK